jgi:hypothetical protein
MPFVLVNACLVWFVLLQHVQNFFEISGVEIRATIRVTQSSIHTSDTKPSFSGHSHFLFESGWT